MSERERFEKWMHTQEKLPYLKRLPAGPYADPVVQIKWNTWQAAKAEAAERERALEAEVERLKKRGREMLDYINQTCTCDVGAFYCSDFSPPPDSHAAPAQPEQETDDDQ